MPKVINHHHAALGLPLGGPVLPPGVPTEVKRWSVIKGHAVVKSWLQASVIEEAGTDEPAEPESAPEPVSGPADDDDLAILRAEYHNKTGKRAYHGWDADTLRAKIADAGKPVGDGE